MLLREVCRRRDASAEPAIFRTSQRLSCFPCYLFRLATKGFVTFGTTVATDRAAGHGQRLSHALGQAMLTVAFEDNLMRDDLPVHKCGMHP